MPAAKVLQPQFYISNLFRECWRIYKKRFIELYAVILIPFVVSFGYSWLVNSAANFQHIFPENSLGILHILYLIFQYFVGAAVYKATIHIIRDEKIAVGEIISWTARHFVKFILGLLLYMTVVLVGFFLLIIPGLIWSIKYAFIPLLIIDKGVGPREAMKLSAEMTDGVKWDIVGYYLAVFLVMYSGFLALFIGIIVTMPFGILATYLFYDRLQRRLNTAPALKK